MTPLQNTANLRSRRHDIPAASHEILDGGSLRQHREASRHPTHDSRRENEPGMRVRSRLIAGIAACAISQMGCSIFSPVPVWELAKATGAAASTAITSMAPTRASNTVYHLHPAFNSLCIEFNPDVQVADIVPALQAELRNNRIDSRLYETAWVEECRVWLKYTASIEWDIPPFSRNYETYVSTVALTLLSAGSGKILSTSTYQLNGPFQLGKWATTREKLAPVVTALVTGFEN